MASNKYQTITEFLYSPFHARENVEKDVTYNLKYRSFVASNKIRVFAVCIVEDSYYMHIKIPSESQKNGKYEYDVVIRFFTDDPAIQKQENLRSYYVQFFSNSPSFMYQYAYLYNKEGFLIKALYSKLDPDYIDTPPEKRNSNMIISYDKSIYFAVRFLSEKKFRYLDKRGCINLKKVDEKRFFNNISDFKSVRLDQSLMAEEKKLSTLIKQKAPKSLVGQIKSIVTGKKIESSKSTVKGSSVIKSITKKGAKSKIVGSKKKTSKKSTWK